MAFRVSPPLMRRGGMGFQSWLFVGSEGRLLLFLGLFSSVNSLSHLHSCLHTVLRCYCLWTTIAGQRFFFSCFRWWLRGGIGRLLCVLLERFINRADVLAY